MTLGLKGMRFLTIFRVGISAETCALTSFTYSQPIKYRRRGLCIEA